MAPHREFSGLSNRPALIWAPAFRLKPPLAGRAVGPVSTAGDMVPTSDSFAVLLEVSRLAAPAESPSMPTLTHDAVEAAQHNAVPWIDDGQKYAVIALRVKLDDPVPLQEMTPHHWAFADARFDMPPHWREWLGTIRTEEVESSNLFLLSKMRSQAPEIVDAETAELRRRAGHFYAGLLLASSFAPAHKPVMLAGYRQNGQIKVRSQDDLEPDIPSIVRPYPAVTLADLQLAAKIATQIETIETAPLNGGHWRLFRVLHLYLEARTMSDTMDRLHQYCRCIDGLIVSDRGQGKSKFKSRTELFIGPRHHGMMGETYDVRSDIEHLHENRHLEVFDRTARLELVKKLEMMEYIARSALVHVLLEPKLWQHFANTPALQAFWALDDQNRRALWGAPINPNDALAEFDPRYISDAELGGP
jgi:hypothetical protein